jgi:hypothetical protein
MMNIKQKRVIMANIGKALIDLGKLTFGGVVIGAIVTEKIDRIVLVIGGTIVTVFLIILGSWFVSLDKE